MSYYHDFIDLCKKQIDPRSLLEWYGATRIIESGNELIHSCLIDTVMPHHQHQDSSPSAALNSVKLYYNCFGFGGGSIIWFIQQMEQVDDLYVAIDVLRNFLTGDYEQSTEQIKQRISECFAVDDLPETIPNYNSSILESWKVIHPYLVEDRKLNPRVLVAHRVGYDEQSNHIIVPHFWNDKLVGWQRRKIDSPRWPQLPGVELEPKWRSSPSFPRRQTLYNYSSAITHAVLVVEAPLSVLAWEGFRQYVDLPPAVATFGSAVSETQAKLLRVFDTVTIYFDDDLAGYHGTLKLLNMLNEYVQCFVVIDPPGRKDPADIDFSQARDSYSNAVPAIVAIPLLTGRIQNIKQKQTRHHIKQNVPPQQRNHHRD